ncbi:hypothetical protein BH11BAC2_BH11BAC2_01020 [soil metagenome]
MKNFTRCFFFCFFLLNLFGLQVSAQVQNSLSFDGVDDYVTIPAASSMISGSTEMTLSCWVYPTNANPAYPNFDGFTGIRNDIDADFYLVQISPSNTVEARFRNSVGTAYDIVYSGLQLNTWQHFTFTYDGSLLRLYKNGFVVDSAAATGSITNSAVDLTVGNVIFANASFYLAGKMDEVSLWSRALTAPEITCLPGNGIAPGANGLELYYKCNQGIAGGGNTAITSLTDETGNINGTFNNMALTGLASNFVAGATSATSITAFVCPGVAFNFNGTNVYGPGTFYDTLTTTNGCDSVVALTLSLLFVNTNVITSGSTMTASLANSTYQWLDCNNGYAPIAGATSQSYTPTTNGSYAVSVVQSGCTDTSNCITLTNVGIDQPLLLSGVTVYPVIMQNELTINLGTTLTSKQIFITDVTGKEIFRFPQVIENELRIDVSSMSSGIYFLKVMTDSEERSFKLFKN